MKNEYSNYTNSELRRVIDSLSNEYDSIKNQIEKLCQRMDDIEKNYLLAEKELNNRRSID